MEATNLRKYIMGLAVMAGAGFAACTKEPADGDGRPDLRVRVSIVRQHEPASTRATTQYDQNESQDQWSYLDFSEDDALGFYAAVKSGDPLINIEMTYRRTEEDQKADGSFDYEFKPAGGVTIEPERLKSSDIFMYFPYSPAISTDGGYELRTRMQPYSGARFPDGPWRCVDFLTASGVSAADYAEGLLTGQLFHAFSELVILRGEGFDKPKTPAGSTDDPERIVVRLKQAYTHVKILNTTNPWSCKVAFVSAPNADGTSQDPDGNTLDAHIWEAWKGGNFSQTEGDTEGREAWYVILPTTGGAGSDARSQIEYIQLYDNEGVLQTIKDLPLHDDPAAGTSRITGRLTEHWRYPIEVAMQELVPTVFPYTVEKWEDKDITNERTRGIYAQNFDKWLNAYNAYLNTPDNASLKNALKAYGDWITDDNGSRWHFYLFEDIDLGSYPDNTDDPIIPTLKDVLDGKTSPAASPVTLRNLKRPFVGTLSGKLASLLFDAEAPYLELSRTDPAGCVVNYNEGTIEYCTVNQGYLSSRGPVGMIAGSNAGIINHCSATGVVAGTASDAGTGRLVGTVANGAQAGIGNVSTVVFNEIAND